MSEPTTAASSWTPRRLMIAALLLHLVSLPLPYSHNTLRGFVTSDRPSNSEMYRRTGSRGLANDFDYGRTRTVNSTGAEGKNGFQHSPPALLILPFLLWAFAVAEPKGGFWARRRGYLVSVGLLFVCGATITAIGGQIALAALLIAGYAAYSRYATSSSTVVGAPAPVSVPPAAAPLTDSASPAVKKKRRSRAKTPPAAPPL